MKPVIRKENVTSLLDGKYIKVFDLQYEEGKHYFDATRRDLDHLAAVKSDEDFRRMLPDGVTCVVILQIKDEEPKLLLSKEYRYPAGQFLLSPPAGLLDSEDILADARREIAEETGLHLTDKDKLFLINPLLFSSPGMTDESNAFACAVVHLDDTSSLSQKGAVGSECFDGFELLTAAEAREIIQSGTDREGVFYSLATWACLLYFISDLWR